MKYIKRGLIIVYGSRVKRTYTPQSDVDLVIKNSPVVDGHILGSIKDEIDDSGFPYLVDLQFYEELKNPALIDHIDRAGVVLFDFH
ncbi:nucleotidyltransferase family protein [Gracilinema caldarium]|uniref:nucleotidyltransferase family protein n=1 Tax=Gracilinema caldarium TaxID=215591 RepID=UPI0026EC071A|nr:nucleotidyltransferase domain-containing protein [Gracilinema caldarium]